MSATDMQDRHDRDDRRDDTSASGHRKDNRKMDTAVKSASKGKPEAKVPPIIKKVGIIGAGQMGNGIAHVIALAGYDVLMNDIR